MKLCLYSWMKIQNWKLFENLIPIFQHIEHIVPYLRMDNYQKGITKMNKELDRYTRVLSLIEGFPSVLLLNLPNVKYTHNFILECLSNNILERRWMEITPFFFFSPETCQSLCFIDHLYTPIQSNFNSESWNLTCFCIIRLVFVKDISQPSSITTSQFN